jgi:uncharacterized protein
MADDRRPLRTPAVRVEAETMRVDVPTAAAAWVGCWLAGNIVGAAVLGFAGGDADPTPTWVVAIAATCLWVPMLVALAMLSKRAGTGDFRADYTLSFRASDLVGIPIGVLSQLVMIPLLYAPLVEIWPDTFGGAQRESNARELYDSASGLWMVLLVVIVVIGAPFVEELVYRGLLQGAMTRRLNHVVAVVLVSAWFALIHFRPVEYPGLFAVGLVFGVCALVTRRLGMSIVAHMAFNATGLLLVAR